MRLVESRMVPVGLLLHYLSVAVVTREDVITQLKQRDRKRKNSIDSARRQQRPPGDFDERPEDLPM